MYRSSRCLRGRKEFIITRSLPSAPVHDRLFSLALATGLTPLALFIHGYHPYSEDGGLYVAGIKRLLHPELYAASAPFVEAHLRYSLFAPTVAALVRSTNLSLSVALLLVHLASLWATIFAFSLIAEHCFPTRQACAGATLLLTLFLTVPVAGTSLILFDPYVTARSISLPCTLFALYGVLASHSKLPGAPRLAFETWAKPPNSFPPTLLCAGSLLLAATMHPLMAGYALGATLLLACMLSPRPNLRRYGTLALCLTAIAAAAILQHTAPPEPTAYLPIALSRYYWFLSRWQWYELLGLAAPLAILTATASRPGPIQPLARMAVLAGANATLVALLFAHANSSTHLVARLQPLRILQLVYIVMILVLGGVLGDRLLRAHGWRWIAATALFGGIFFAVQRATYSASNHIEWPGRAPVNAYEQVFLWISRNTPVNALFALDAHYISAPQEDAQCFRALAERSALPDYSKDGGEASITPALTSAWTLGQQAQTDLNQVSDADRVAHLRPLNVTWIVLPRESQTAFVCSYRNARVQVCRLP